MWLMFGLTFTKGHFIIFPVLKGEKKKRNENLFHVGGEQPSCPDLLAELVKCRLAQKSKCFSLALGVTFLRLGKNRSESFIRWLLRLFIKLVFFCVCVCLRGGGVHRPTKLLSCVDVLTGFKWLSLLVDCQLCCFLKAGDELKSKHNYRAFIKPRLMRGVWVAGGRKLFSSAQLRFVKHINKSHFCSSRVCMCLRPTSPGWFD